MVPTIISSISRISDSSTSFCSDAPMRSSEGSTTKASGNWAHTLLCPHCANYRPPLTRVTVQSPSPRARYPNRSRQGRGSACKSARPLVAAAPFVVAAGRTTTEIRGTVQRDWKEGISAKETRHETSKLVAEQQRGWRRD